MGIEFGLEPYRRSGYRLDAYITLLSPGAAMIELDKCRAVVPVNSLGQFRKALNSPVVIDTVPAEPDAASRVVDSRAFHNHQAGPTFGRCFIIRFNDLGHFPVTGVPATRCDYRLYYTIPGLYLPDMRRFKKL